MKLGETTEDLTFFSSLYILVPSILQLLGFDGIEEGYMVVLNRVVIGKTLSYGSISKQWIPLSGRHLPPL
jgi:hypothetical protein